MGDFLDSLPFLSPEQRAALRAEDLDTADAFAHVTVQVLQAPPFGLTTGKASRLLAAVAKSEAPAVAPANITLSIPEPIDLRTRIERALRAAEQDAGKVSALLDLGVDTVVLPGGKLGADATLAMRAHAASGAPVGATWHGHKIARVLDISTPAVFCSPRTGRPLQDGKDEVTETPWGTLGLDGLRLAAYGYSEGFFEGMSEAKALAAVGEPETRARIERRMLATETKPEDMDAVVIWSRRDRPERSQAPAKVTRNGSLAANLTTLLLACFSADELRRFLRYQPGGGDFVAGLPGQNSSPASFAHAAADGIIRQGWLSRDLRNALVAERPRRASEIDAVFSAAGV
jgi:hypothetical protein